MKLTGRQLTLLFGIIFIIALAYFFGQIVGFVLIAWVLSMIGQPMMRFLQTKVKIGKFRIGASAASAITLLCYFVIIGLLIGIFVPLIITQANNLAGVDYQKIGAALEVPVNEFNDWLASYGLTNPNSHISVEQQMRDNFSTLFVPDKIQGFFSSVVGAAGNIAISFFSVVFITFFFLKEQGLFVNFLVALLPNEYDEKVRHAIQEISQMLTRYFGGILIQVTIITIFVSAALAICGVKNALLIGFFAALINVIPYVGPLIGATFGVIITISSNLDLEFYNQMLPLLLKVIAVFGAMQLLDNFLLQPWIFSNSVSAHPLEIFIVILMGAQINGIIGMVLAIPAYTVLRVIGKVFLSEFRLVQQITGRM